MYKESGNMSGNNRTYMVHNHAFDISIKMGSIPLSLMDIISEFLLRHSESSSDVWDEKKVLDDMFRLNPNAKGGAAGHRLRLQKYKDIIRKHLIMSVANSYDMMFNEFSITWDNARQELGKYQINGQLKYWFMWFDEHHPLIKRTYIGNSFKKELSKVKIIHPDIILAGHDADDAYDILINDQLTDKSKVDFVPIDQVSLKNYILHNQIDRNNADTNPSVIDKERYKQQLDDNKTTAELILLLSETAQHPGLLPQIVNESEFGRKYYKGVNLQSCSKEVRHAALGSVYQVDMDTSVYVWRRKLIKQIEKECDVKIGSSYTLEYIDNKQGLRKHLANVAFGNTSEFSIQTIKRFITAVSFGATQTSGVWQDENGKLVYTTLATIVKSPDNMKMLLSDSFMKGFLAEQKILSKCIFEYTKASKPPVYFNDIKLRTPKRNISQNKVLAKLYQTAEREAITVLWELSKSLGDEPVLLVHDGFYCKNKPHMQELRYVYTDIFPAGNISCEKEVGNTLPLAADVELLRHAAHMKKEINDLDDVQRNIQNQILSNNKKPKYSSYHNTIDGYDDGYSISHYPAADYTSGYDEADEVMPVRVQDNIKVSAFAILKKMKEKRNH